nr:NAD(P)(+) transhydrogenase (Re/Si-specific) subunit beta [Ralstonia solanacearum]
MNLVTLLYLLASVCFIQALKGLSHPGTARRGNVFGMSGMAIAAVTTVALIVKLKAEMFAGTESGTSTGVLLIFAGLVVGGGIGAYVARTVEMTKMPELVAAMHSLIGLAAVCIAVAAVAEPSAFGITLAGDNVLPLGNRMELFIGTFVGAITFSGSVIAFGKLSGKYKFRLFQGAPVQFAGQHMLNLLLAVAMLGFGILFFLSQSWLPFIIMTAIAFALGVLIIIPIGGADMTGGGVDAELLLRLGRRRASAFSLKQPDADHRRLAGRFLRCDPVVHHVPGDEPIVLSTCCWAAFGFGGLRRGRGSVAA